PPPRAGSGTVREVARLDREPRTPSDHARGRSRGTGDLRRRLAAEWGTRSSSPPRCRHRPRKNVRFCFDRRESFHPIAQIAAKAGRSFLLRAEQALAVLAGVEGFKTQLAPWQNEANTNSAVIN